MDPDPFGAGKGGASVSVEATASRAGSRSRFASGVLGDVFLGVAVGLLSYYVLTGTVAHVEQTDLREQAPAAVLREEVVEAGPAFDFEGWDSEDAAYFDDLAPGEVFGRIVADDARLDAMVIKGVRAQDLKRGPGWIDYTGVPGPTGNVGVSGHRTTYGAPFRRIDRLKKGATISFYSPYRRYTYEVVRSFTVTPDRVDVVADTSEPVLTLTACHPPYSARLRLIVQAKLVEVRRLVN